MYVNQIEMALSEVGTSELRQIITGDMSLEEALEEADLVTALMDPPIRYAL